MGKMKDRLIEDMELHPESYSKDDSDYMSEEELKTAHYLRSKGYDDVSEYNKDALMMIKLREEEQGETLQDKMRDEHVTSLMKEALDQEDKE